MTTMHVTLNEDAVQDGIELRMYAENTRAEVRTILRDTDHGFEWTTTVTDAEGNARVVTDKVDRATPPLHLMGRALNSMVEPFLIATQAALNKARYERLVRDGKPITMQTMCMDGMHTGPAFADVPFQGGIQGVPSVATDVPKVEDDAVSDELLAQLWGEDDAEEEAA